MREETVLPFCRPNLTLRQKLEGSSAVCQPQGWLLLPGLAGVVEPCRVVGVVGVVGVFA